MFALLSVRAAIKLGRREQPYILESLCFCRSTPSKSVQLSLRADTDSRRAQLYLLGVALCVPALSCCEAYRVHNKYQVVTSLLMYTLVAQSVGRMLQSAKSRVRISPCQGFFLCLFLLLINK